MNTDLTAQRLQSGMDTYVPSAPADRLQPAGDGSPDQDMQRQVEEFNRSITIVLWYKAKTEPLRLQQTIPTFPYFQLSRLSSLMSDLGLTPSTYLDTYNSQSGRWEQHTIGSVRLVETQQRLLYRIRQSLFEGLPEDDCLSLGEEVELQAKPTRGGVVAAAPRAHDEGMGTLKRSAPDMPDPGPAAKRQATNGYYMNASPAVFGASAPSTQPDGSPPAPQIESQNGSSTSNNNSVAAAAAAAAAAAYLYQSTLSFTPHSASPHPLPPYLTNPNHGSTPIPYHPHPPLKRWPNDYTVSELSAGFLAMEALISQSPTGASMTQRAAFERVFGSRYVKSTVCRHRGVWRKAHPGVREQFEKMGGDERACWGEFVRRVEGRPVAGKLGPGLAQQQQPIAYHGPPGAAMVAHPGHGTDSQNAPEGGSEPAMGSLQDPATQGSGPNLTMQSHRPVSSLQGGNGMPPPPNEDVGVYDDDDARPDLNIYDPALAHNEPS